jgi:hypothetical protein
MTKTNYIIPNWYYIIKSNKTLNRVFENSIENPNSSAVKAILFNNFSVPMSEKFECITDIFKSVMLHCKPSDKNKSSAYHPTHFHQTNNHPYFWRNTNTKTIKNGTINTNGDGLTVTQRMWSLPDIQLDDFTARRTELWSAYKTIEEYAGNDEGCVSTEAMIRCLVDLERNDGEMTDSNVDNLLDQLTAECADHCDYEETDYDYEDRDHEDTTDSSWSSYNNGTLSNILHRLNTLSPEQKATVEEYIRYLNNEETHITLDYIIQKLTPISL